MHNATTSSNSSPNANFTGLSLFLLASLAMLLGLRLVSAKELLQVQPLGFEQNVRIQKSLTCGTFGAKHSIADLGFSTSTRKTFCVNSLSSVSVRLTSSSNFQARWTRAMQNFETLSNASRWTLQTKRMKKLSNEPRKNLYLTNTDLAESSSFATLRTSPKNSFPLLLNFTRPKTAFASNYIRNSMHLTSYVEFKNFSKDHRK